MLRLMTDLQLPPIDCIRAIKINRLLLLYLTMFGRKRNLFAHRRQPLTVVNVLVFIYVT